MPEHDADDSRSQAAHGRGRGPGGRTGHPLRLGDPGPGGRRVRARVRRLRRRAARLRRLQRHDRAAPGAPGRRRAPGRRGRSPSATPTSPPRTSSATAARCPSSSTSGPTPSTSTRRGSRRSSRRGRGRSSASTRSACPASSTAIVDLARRRGLAVVEDAACAIGSEIEWDGRWERIGRPHGDVACFSFHPRKLVSTGDGGMITTANAEWDASLRLWRQHGMSVPDTTRHGASQVIFESYPMVGYNYRLTDIQAAVGREQLKRLPGHPRAAPARSPAGTWRPWRDVAGAHAAGGAVAGRAPTGRASACGWPTASTRRRSCSGCSTAGIASRRGRHVRAPRAGVPAGDLDLPAGRRRDCDCAAGSVPAASWRARGRRTTASSCRSSTR